MRTQVLGHPLDPEILPRKEGWSHTHKVARASCEVSAYMHEMRQRNAVQIETEKESVSNSQK